MREMSVQIDGGPIIAVIEDNGNRGSAIVRSLRDPVVREMLAGRDCQRVEFPRDDLLNFITKARLPEN